MKAAHSIYVASWYQNAPAVRDLHDRLLALGVTPTSSWASTARGAENLTAMSRAELVQIAIQNDRDLGNADAVIAIAGEGVGGEMFAELRLALMLSKPVYYVGQRRILSAYRPGVVLCADVDEAMAFAIAGVIR